MFRCWILKLYHLAFILNLEQNNSPDIVCQSAVNSIQHEAWPSLFGVMSRETTLILNYSAYHLMLRKSFSFSLYQEKAL